MSTLHLHTIKSTTLNAPTLVLLHGWGMNNGIWQQMLAHLEDVNCLLLELPGHGKSPSLNLEDNLASVREAWLALLIAQLPKEPFYLCGWSLGGLLALAIQQRLPERIKALALITTTPCFAAREHWLGLSREELDLFGKNLGDDKLSALRHFWALQFAGAHNSKGEMRALLRTLRTEGKADISGLQQGLCLLRGLDLRAAFADLGANCQLLLGDKDPLITPQAGAMIQRLNPQINVRSWQCAHAPHFIFPARTALWLGNMWR